MNLRYIKEYNVFINENFDYDDIDLNDLENINFNSGLDSPDNENENDGLGLNAFMNKLPGGKNL